MTGKSKEEKVKMSTIEFSTQQELPTTALQNSGSWGVRISSMEGLRKTRITSRVR